MTSVRTRETLTCVDAEIEKELAQAADEFVAGPKKLQAAILRAAARGENANQITKAIKQVYSPDYVRTLIREARKRGQIPPRDDA